MKLSSVFLTLLFSLTFSSGSAEATCSDLSLVLAIDGSASIDESEYALQIAGYGNAFYDPDVQDALARAGIVDLAVVFWADSDFAFQTIPWHRIKSSGDALEFSSEIVQAKRTVTGDTDIGAGLWSALDLIDDPERCTFRAIVNISGDGMASVSQKRKPNKQTLARAKARAADLGVVVNGLVITNAVPTLEYYYRQQVITGSGSFVMQVGDFTDFDSAIKQKLIHEIDATLVSSLD
jgi:hypothetical protein